MRSFPLGEWRRLQAVRLHEQAWKQRDIAQALEVTPGAVSQWLTAARRDGLDVLQSRPPPGRASRLSADQKRLIPDFLWHGAEAYGFHGDVWTCRRVASVLAEEFDLLYSKSQVSRLLKNLGWTPQIPLTRAIQRDEAAIEHWRTEAWPKIKRQAQKKHQALVFIDEAGFYLLPAIVKTYAPKGLTPILQEWQTRDHLSIMCALTAQAKTYTLVRQESLNGLHTVEFLTHLLRVAGERLLIIWDGSPIHRRREVKDFLAQGGAGHIHIESLPFYAPDLNPVEWEWAYLKEVELRNLTCLDLEELHLQFHLALGRMRQRPRLLKSFFAGAGLSL